MQLGILDFLSEQVFLCFVVVAWGLPLKQGMLNVLCSENLIIRGFRTHLVSHHIKNVTSGFKFPHFLKGEENEVGQKGGNKWKKCSEDTAASFVTAVSYLRSYPSHHKLPSSLCCLHPEFIHIQQFLLNNELIYFFYMRHRSLASKRELRS